MGALVVRTLTKKSPTLEKQPSMIVVLSIVVIWIDGFISSWRTAYPCGLPLMNHGPLTATLGDLYVMSSSQRIMGYFRVHRPVILGFLDFQAVAASLASRGLSRVVALEAACACLEEVQLVAASPLKILSSSGTSAGGELPMLCLYRSLI